MALIGIVQFAERLLNQAQENNQAQQVSSKQAAQAKPAGNSDGDQFTPSTQIAAQDPGLFQVSNFSIFSAAADFILTEPAAAQTQAAGSNATTAQTAGANYAAANAAATQNTQQNAAAPAAPNTAAPASPIDANAAPAAQANPTDTATNAAGTAAATGTAGANATNNATAATGTQTQLQSLNATLAALGLSQDEITVIDRVAQLIKDFNPQAYTDIINQLEALAQAAAPQTTVQNATQNAAQTPTPNTGQNAAQTTAATAAPAAAANAAQPAAQTANGANATNAGFTIQELSIKFSGAEGAITQTAKNGKNAGAAQFSAFNLQIEEVQITLGNGTGQTAQIQAPQTSAATTAAQTQTQEKAAGA
jgi:flagellar hook-length control protein FliK